MKTIDVDRIERELKTWLTAKFNAFLELQSGKEMHQESLGAVTRFYHQLRKGAHTAGSEMYDRNAKGEILAAAQAKEKAHEADSNTDTSTSTSPRARPERGQEDSSCSRSGG